MLLPAFPPMPRPLKLLKHLPSFDWQVQVIAPADAERADNRFGQAAPQGVTVRLTASPPSFARWMRRARGPAVRAPAAAHSAPGALALPGWERIARRLALWLNTPDEDVAWIPLAVWSGLRAVRGGPIRAIYATGPPFSVVLAGTLLKGVTGLPLISDFRDAWTLDATDPFGVIGGAFRAPYGAGRIATLRKLEAYCLRRSDLVLFTSYYTKDAYAAHYPTLGDRVDIIFNGVDEEDFAEPARSFPHFTFAYVGTLHPYQLAHVELFLRAFSEARSRAAPLLHAQVMVAGHRPPAFDQRLQDLAASLGIQESLTLGPAVPHAESVAITRGADVLLLFDGGSPFMRFSKISDYAAVGTPILGLAGSEGETARHLRELGHPVYSGSSPEGLGQLIIDRWGSGERWKRAPGPFPFRFPHPLSWKTAAQQLARHLDSLTQRTSIASP